MARITFDTNSDDQLLLVVVLSERNLWTLLTKLYTPGSFCEIHNNDCPPENAYTRICAEPDGLHYASPTRGRAFGLAGGMDPRTEAIIARVRPLIETAVAEVNALPKRGRRF